MKNEEKGTWKRSEEEKREDNNGWRKGENHILFERGEKVWYSGRMNRVKKGRKGHGREMMKKRGKRTVTA